ncbi:MAG: tryptophan synthase subunit alpha [Candidatus Eisenbacteria bacterium]|nr:tryptophan synthase subunit alpha [Candidatus Eisenbacteria bacterium]
MSRTASRIGPAFAAMSGRTGLIPFLTAGYPSLEATLEMARGLARGGALAIEIGIPFSDPIADGREIQRASEWALRHGVSLGPTLDLVRAFRRDSDTPVVLMTYANPILLGGVERFASEAGESGVDGVIVSDVPPEESPELWRAMDAAGLDTVTLVAPTTERSRLANVLARSRGFVYCLARTGVTGKSAGEGGALPARIAELRAHTALPIAVGFGISGANDARALRGVADAVVVGAAFMRGISSDPGRGARERVLTLAGEIQAALA